MTELLKIADVSRRSGVASSALRFYEERGLISSERSGSGHRRYPRAVLRRIAFIVFAQRIGLTLDEIGGELAKLPANRAPGRRDWSRLSSQWTTRIDQRIAELERLRSGLTDCIGCGCLSLGRCALSNVAYLVAGLVRRDLTCAPGNGAVRLSAPLIARDAPAPAPAHSTTTGF
jgi:MerR family transcriptional regulator, redox-sensitive transcriptional activator SoxR